MRAKLLRREALPFLLVFFSLVLAAIFIDAFFQGRNAESVRRYLGIPGTLLILSSFGYSLRKRKLFRHGNPLRWLRWHERIAWLGSLLVLVHAGVHFRALLAWLAVGALLINVGSGLTGKFLLGRARRILEQSRHDLSRQGLSDPELEEHLHWDSLTVDLLKKWRVVHLPLSMAFAILALGHIVAILLFWGWR